MALEIMNQVNVSPKGLGNTLNNIISETIEFCIKYNCECRLQFNGTTRTITKFTDPIQCFKGWYN